ncbi:hypothetical protein HMPREF3220_01591 [Citrobacter koseri]|nr:hypothetical protein HMPREF3220_01591 [Citrobacter koseri]KXA06667.1 hypothetical protein HMPREF3207_00052 [Citrobacter koseri]
MDGKRFILFSTEQECQNREEGISESNDVCHLDGRCRTGAYAEP